jgi:hypothetical protein
MARLDVQRNVAGPGVTLRSPPNWTAVLFFAALSSLHLFIAVTAFVHQRWEAFMSVIFAIIFAVLAVACRLIRTELAVLAGERSLRIRTGTRRIFVERNVPFTRFRSVRLTLLNPRTPESATIELVCDHEVIECPPTSIPREEALCLAVTMGVRFIKVYGEDFGAASERQDQFAAPGGDSR